MSELNDIIRQIRKDYEACPWHNDPSLDRNGILATLDRRIGNLEKIVLFFLDKEGPKEDERT